MAFRASSLFCRAWLISCYICIYIKSNKIIHLTVIMYIHCLCILVYVKTEYLGTDNKSLSIIFGWMQSRLQVHKTHSSCEHKCFNRRQIAWKHQPFQGCLTRRNNFDKTFYLCPGVCLQKTPRTIKQPTICDSRRTSYKRYRRYPIDDPAVKRGISVGLEINTYISSWMIKLWLVSPVKQMHS